jgi:hypothetical protein
MAVSMHQISVPIFIRHLTGLAVVIGKAQALYKEKALDETTLLTYRFYPDMFSFTRQVQAATDHAVACTSLLAGVEPIKHEGNEKSLDDLLGRIDKTIAFLGSVKASQVDGTEDKQVVVKMRDREMNFKGLDLLQNRSLPNFYFHCTTAYDIIRHNGVEIGKRHFMGAA